MALINNKEWRGGTGSIGSLLRIYIAKDVRVQERRQCSDIRFWCIVKYFKWERMDNHFQNISIGKLILLYK